MPVFLMTVDLEEGDKQRNAKFTVSTKKVSILCSLTWKLALPHSGK